MFDVNLLNSPGIQSNSEEYRNIDSESKNKTSIDNATQRPIVDNKKTNISFKLFVLLGSICLLIFYLFNYNYLNLNQFIQNKTNHSYDTEIIVPELKKYSDKVNFNYMVFSKNQLSIQLKMRNSDTFYSILDRLSNIIFDKVKGYRINNNLVIDINAPWKINENSNFNIILLDKELSDYKPSIKKEIYKDKLIVVTDTSQLFEFLEFLFEINIIKNFNIDIEPIQSMPNTMKLYKIILY